MKIEQNYNYSNEQDKYTNEINQLIKKFIFFFEIKGILLEKSVKISSGIDSSVNLIGSHISIFKKYLKTDIPQEGVFMFQNCIRTQNLKIFYEYDKLNSWASYFPSLGVLCPPSKKKELFNLLFNFLESINLTKEDLIINATTKDLDLVDLLKTKKNQYKINYDTKNENYYRHKIGMDNIIGRNFNILIRDSNTDEFYDIGNYIILENNKKILGVELALGASNIIKLTNGLKHVLDCFPIVKFNELPNKVNYKLKDALIVSTLLYHENVKPNKKKGASRVLYEYLKGIRTLQEKYNINIEEIKVAIETFEFIYIRDNISMSQEITQQIINYKAKK